jgi:hypothetical protein
MSFNRHASQTEWLYFRTLVSGLQSKLAHLE